MSIVQFIKSLVTLQLHIFPVKNDSIRSKYLFLNQVLLSTKIFSSRQDLGGQVVAMQLLAEDGKSEGCFHKVKIFIKSNQSHQVVFSLFRVLFNNYKSLANKPK